MGSEIAKERERSVNDWESPPSRSLKLPCFSDREGSGRASRVVSLLLRKVIIIRLGLSSVRRLARTRRPWTPTAFPLEPRTLLTTGQVQPIASGATPIPQAVIQFDQPVTGFDLDDLILSRDGGPNLLTGQETLTTDDGATWTLGGLESLTARPGNYILMISTRGVDATVYTEGHADLDLRLDHDHWTLGAVLEDHDHEGEDHDHEHGDHDHDHESVTPSDQVVFFAGPMARTVRLADAAFDFIGVASGATYWRLPQNADPNLLFPGFSTEALPAGAVGSYVETDPRVISTAQPWVTYQVVGVDGPGEFSIWASDDEGPLVWVSTVDGLNASDKVIVPTGTHVHYNLGFTAPGVYRVILQASYLDANGQQVVSKPAAYVFGVETTAGFPVVDAQTNAPLAMGATAEFVIAPPPPAPPTTFWANVVALFGNRRANIFNALTNPTPRTLPWTTTLGMELTFDRPLADPGSMIVSLVDPLGRSVPFNTLSFDPSHQTMTITTPVWRLDGGYTLTITHSELAGGSAVFQTNLARGDVNGDGVANQRDRRLLQSATHRPPRPMNPEMRTRSNLDGRGGVNRRDLAVLNAILANRTGGPRPASLSRLGGGGSFFFPSFLRRG